MFKEFRKEIDWGGRRLVLETGKIARQADGAVIVTLGETKVLCTVVYEKTAKAGLDFFPLSVHYQEKSFAAGKIPGGFFKREGRPAEREVLISRLIDRPIRPLFAKGYRCETQVICTVLSHDLENDPDIASLVGTSAALTLSGVPFLGPVAGCRVGYIRGEYVLNPQLDEMANSELDLVVAGTRDGVLMVESEAKELSEDVMLGAVMFGHRSFQPVIRAIIELAQACAKEPVDLPPPPEGLPDLAVRIRSMAEGDLREAYTETVKSTRRDKVVLVKKRLVEALSEDESVDQGLVTQAMDDQFKELEKDVVRRAIVATGRRIDNRSAFRQQPFVFRVHVGHGKSEADVLVLIVFRTAVVVHGQHRFLRKQGTVHIIPARVRKAQQAAVKRRRSRHVAGEQAYFADSHDEVPRSCMVELQLIRSAYHISEALPTRKSVADRAGRTRDGIDGAGVPWYHIPVLRAWWNGRHKGLKILRFGVRVQLPLPAPFDQRK